MAWKHLQSPEAGVEKSWVTAFDRTLKLLASLNLEERRRGIIVDATLKESPGIIQAARESGTSIWLCGPKTMKSAEAEKENRVEFNEAFCGSPDLVEGDSFVFIATSGSTGRPKWVRHSWSSLLQAAKRLDQTPACTGFHLSPLPLWHVSGLMPWIRAEAQKGVCEILESVESVATKHKGAWVSIVPTQLYRITQSGSEIAPLKQLGGIFVGGGKLDSGLAQQARQLGLPLAPCYGMTETAAMVSVLWPEFFLNGCLSCGSPLGGINLHLDLDGQLTISGRGLMLSYSWKKSIRKIKTNDLASWNSREGLQILGRTDRVIISGGENISLQLLENEIFRIRGVQKAVASADKDSEWGQRVKLEVWSTSKNLDPETIRNLLKKRLPGYYLPRVIKIYFEG